MTNKYKCLNNFESDIEMKKKNIFKVKWYLSYKWKRQHTFIKLQDYDFKLLTDFTEVEDINYIFACHSFFI